MEATSLVGLCATASREVWSACAATKGRTSLRLVLGQAQEHRRPCHGPTLPAAGAAL